MISILLEAESEKDAFGLSFGSTALNSIWALALQALDINTGHRRN